MKKVGEFTLHYTDKEIKIIEKFLTRLKTKKSKNNYRRIMDYFKSHLTLLNKTFLDVTVEDCKAFITEVDIYYGKKLSDKTKETIYSTLYSFYNYMASMEIIEKNPWNSIKKPKAPRNIPKKSTMTGEQMSKFIEAALCENKRDRALALIFATTGLKTGEAIKIKWSHFFTDKNGNIGLYVEDANNDNKSRVVKILDKVWEYLLDYRQSLGKSIEIPLDDHSYVFLNEKGKPISESWALKVVKRICRKAKLDKEYSPSAMRHTFAKFVLMANWVGQTNPNIGEKLTQTMGWSQKHLIRRYEGVMYELEDAPVDNLYFNFNKMEEENN